MLTNIINYFDFHLGSNDDKGIYGTIPKKELIDDIGSINLKY
jgi:hypothetical protein